MHIVKEKRFYINLLTITIPIALQNLISFATSMMDTIMLGRADDTGVFLSLIHISLIQTVQRFTLC